MSMSFNYSLVSQGGRRTLTAFRPDADEPLVTTTDANPNFDDIVSGLEAGDWGVWELFDLGSSVASKFSQVTERVSFDGRNILWDGDPVHSTLADQLRRLMESGRSDDYLAVARFWEKLESNPNEHSREQAYDFLATHAFQITPDGDVIGYKGVASNPDGTYSSVYASKVAGKPSAYVNGQPQKPKSRVTQSVGDVVSMPRSEVTHDPSRACERGLHVATNSYARGYGNTVMTVSFNPRDIVSVPTADRGEKVRVCRYKVLEISSGEAGDSVVLRGGNSWAGDVGYAPE